MKIRQLTVDELPMLSQYGQQFLDESGHKDTFCAERFEWYWKTLYQAANATVLVAFDGETFAGAISGFVCPDPHALGYIAQEGFWYVVPAHRHTRVGPQLYSAFEAWARTFHITQIRVGCIAASKHHDVICRFFLKRDYQPYESHFMKRI